MRIENGQVVLEIGDRVMGLISAREGWCWNILGQEGVVVDRLENTTIYKVKFDNNIGGWGDSCLGIPEGCGLHVKGTNICYRGQ